MENDDEPGIICESMEEVNDSNQAEQVRNWGADSLATNDGEM